MLGTGKLDLRALRKLAEEAVKGKELRTACRPTGSVACDKSAVSRRLPNWNTSWQRLGPSRRLLRLRLRGFSALGGIGIDI